MHNVTGTTTTGHISNLSALPESKKYLKTEKVCSWFTCRQNLALMTGEGLVLVYHTWNENPKVLQKYRSSPAPCSTGPGEGRGIQNIQNTYNVACLKSETFWNTFGAQGLNKWPLAQGIPLPRDVLDNESHPKITCDPSRTNNDRNLMKKEAYISITDENSSLLYCNESPGQCYRIKIWHHPLSPPG